MSKKVKKLPDLDWMRAKLAQSCSATKRPSGKVYKRKSRTQRAAE